MQKHKQMRNGNLPFSPRNEIPFPSALHKQGIQNTPPNSALVQKHSQYIHDIHQNLTTKQLNNKT